ncbi:MAG TPA: septum formation initiator family protein [Solirubrobacteraceae bacterium]
MALPRTRIRWDRIGRIALLGVLAFVLYLYIGPTRNLFATYGESKERRAQVAELRTENAKLRARERELRSRSALEKEARRLGMVKAGEKAYVVEGLPK